MRRPAPGPTVASLAARAPATRVLIRYLVAASALTTGFTPMAHAAPPAPYSAHSMIYTCCTPYELKQRMFAEAKAMRSSFIRLDVEVEPIFELWASWRQQPDWIELDQVMALSPATGYPSLESSRRRPPSSRPARGGRPRQVPAERLRPLREPGGTDCHSRPRCHPPLGGAKRTRWRLGLSGQPVPVRADAVSHLPRHQVCRS